MHPTVTITTVSKSDSRVRHFTFNSVCQDHKKEQQQRQQKQRKPWAQARYNADKCTYRAMCEWERKRKRDRDNHRPSTKRRSTIFGVFSFAQKKERTHSHTESCCYARFDLNINSRNDSLNLKLENNKVAKRDRNELWAHIWVLRLF